MGVGVTYDSKHKCGLGSQDGCDMISTWDKRRTIYINEHKE